MAYKIYGRGNSYPKTYTDQYRNSQPQAKKRSGSKHGQYKNNGKNFKAEFIPWVNGWFLRGKQLVKVLCTPYKGTTTGTSKQSGKRWETWIAKIQPAVGASYLQSCMYYPDSHKVVIRSMGIVVNPKAPNGGYCGRYFQK
jgi:hypothetical protein